MKKFDIPTFYRSDIIGPIKEARKNADPRKQDFTPTLLDFGPVQFIVARHFGFCYGVENAIEISYHAIHENPGKRIFLLSQMIHNPDVNEDLQGHGIRFIMDTEGNQLIPWEELKPQDVVIIPAFGTTVETEAKLRSLGIEPTSYNTTCPFVEKVWKRSAKLGDDRFSVIIHGKHRHEETRATFSHSYQNAPSLVIKDLKEAHILGDIILGKSGVEEFEHRFRSRASAGFNPTRDLSRIGVVNQTTMLASETQAIADHLKQVMMQKFGEDSYRNHFADTRDTLCYATNDNQGATLGLLEVEADLAIVVGGYNSSNTSHLVELCEEKFPTYFISSEKEILEDGSIRHFNWHEQRLEQTIDFLPKKEVLRIALTSGASCPDAIVDRVMQRFLAFYADVRPVEDVIHDAIGA
ncbi:MAG: 4-hydroxy-3-methylbut-2-enyl diphosphate reductase [Flavobacteriales bacterium]|nr:4-hydroxy-3-methylbut-2-enyl diphosphate reductase [Flavobacteriales bacterium]